jgi:hypothetical protein
MAAATVTFKTSLDVQPPLSGGLATGLDLSFQQSVANVSIAVTERRGFSFTLPLTGNNQVVSFGGITVGTFLLIYASAPVRVTMTITGANASVFCQFYILTVGFGANPITGCNVTSLTDATTVDVQVAG